MTVPLVNPLATRLPSTPAIASIFSASARPAAEWTIVTSKSEIDAPVFIRPATPLPEFVNAVLTAASVPEMLVALEETVTTPVVFINSV